MPQLAEITESARRSSTGSEALPSDAPRIVPRACDQCHARKVKCDGFKPCSRCSTGKVSCTFEKPVRPKGPPPKRRRSQLVSSPEGESRRKKVGRDEAPRTQETPASFASPRTLGSLSSEQPSADHPQPSQPTPSDLFNYDQTGSFLDMTAVDQEAANGAILESPQFANILEPLLRLSEAALHPQLPTSGGGPIDPPSPVQESSSSDSEGSYEDDDDWGPTAIVSRPSGLALPPISPTTLPWQSTPAISMAGLGGSSGFGFNFGTGFVPSPMAFDMPFAPPAEISPILSLTMETLVKPQLDVFFERVFPMIPVFNKAYMRAKLDDRRSRSDRGFAALVLAMVAISLIHPLTPEETEQREGRARQAASLLDEVCRLRAHWDYGGKATVETVLTSYLMFGTLFELGHADSSRFRLLESIIMAQSMRLGDVSTYLSLAPDEAKRRMRMYWILAITERAYALQRSGTIVFTGPIAITEVAGSAEGVSLHHLARVFTVIDADIIDCWNGGCNRQNCKTLTEKRIVPILRRLHGSAADVFGDEDRLLLLTEVQKADLLITWQWLRNRLWRLAAAHGLTHEGGAVELSMSYVIDAAVTTVAICRRLSEEAMEAHGLGFVEKLYDIASIVTELLQTSPELQTRTITVIHTAKWNDTLQSLYTFVTRHRAGAAFAAPLSEALSLVSSIRLLTETRS